MNFIGLLDSIDSFVWGPPLLILLVGTGVFLSIRLGLIQVFKLPTALKLIFSAKNEGEGDVSSFASLCTALAATVGTGNIVGVATAIAGGGPGALFWMWIAAFFGMATKYAEGLLAIKYRSVDANGNVAGGPMYYIINGLGERFKPLAIFFALSGVLVALLGIGTLTQVNSIVDSMNSVLGVNTAVVSIVIAVIVAVITFGGLESISNVSTKLVPFMCVLYVIMCGTVLAVFYKQIPATIELVITSAFSGKAAIGGFAGATVSLAIRNGIARGVFSNESGLGSAPIAAAAAKTKWPAEQGLISMTGTFLDTIVICTLTGLTLIVSGVWSGDAKGAQMTQNAFATVFSSFGPIVLMISLALFAFTTILGWNYYGERCCEYLFGVKGILPYRILFVIIVGLGGFSFMKLEAVWITADIVNGLMAIPNLIALLGLSGVIVSETKLYLNHLKDSKEEAKEKSVS
jgi:AGCS family alanine or glycine:cation symporter